MRLRFAGNQVTQITADETAEQLARRPMPTEYKPPETALPESTSVAQVLQENRRRRARGPVELAEFEAMSSRELAAMNAQNRDFWSKR